jgi:D-ribose pyranase
MRRDGLWHAELLGVLTDLRHTDTLVLADAGLPVPAGVPVIDLGWLRDEPRLIPLLDAVLEELVVERAEIAKEAADEHLLEQLADRLSGVFVERITHDELKAACTTARVVVRTGEATPYANVVLHAGVPFGKEPAA